MSKVLNASPAAQLGVTRVCLVVTLMALTAACYRSSTSVEDLSVANVGDFKEAVLTDGWRAAFKASEDWRVIYKITESGHVCAQVVTATELVNFLPPRIEEFDNSQGGDFRVDPNKVSCLTPRDALKGSQFITKYVTHMSNDRILRVAIVPQGVTNLRLMRTIAGSELLFIKDGIYVYVGPAELIAESPRTTLGKDGKFTLDGSNATMFEARVDSANVKLTCQMGASGGNDLCLLSQGK